MLLNILDANGTPQKIITKGQEAIVDSSGTIASTGISQLAAAASATRSGYFFQNLGAHNMWLNELGVATQASGSILVPPGGSFPPPNYPVNTSAIDVVGTAADTYTMRTW